MARSVRSIVRRSIKLGVVLCYGNRAIAGAILLCRFVRRTTPVEGRSRTFLVYGAASEASVGVGEHRRCINVAGRVPAEVAERLRRRADKVRVGTAGRVELAVGGLGEVTEPVELVPRTDRVEVAAQAQLLVSQRRILRFLADAGLVGQHPPFRRIVTVPAFSDLAVQCIDLLNSC